MNTKTKTNTQIAEQKPNVDAILEIHRSRALDGLHRYGAVHAIYAAQFNERMMQIAIADEEIRYFFSDREYIAWIDERTSELNNAEINVRFFAVHAAEEKSGTRFRF